MFIEFENKLNNVVDFLMITLNNLKTDATCPIFLIMLKSSNEL